VFLHLLEGLLGLIYHFVDGDVVEVFSLAEDAVFVFF
jgi:hypothetical protein